jgi:hypothetical protein
MKHGTTDKYRGENTSVFIPAHGWPLPIVEDEGLLGIDFQLAADGAYQLRHSRHPSPYYQTILQSAAIPCSTVHRLALLEAMLQSAIQAERAAPAIGTFQG